MPQPEPNTPTPNDYMQATQRCAAAYHHVMADMPKDLCTAEEREHQYKAFLAFAAELPILSDPAAFQLYIACIAQGVAIGAVDIVDAGRFCHIAQTAMSAWKLANLTVPAAQRKQEAAEKKAKQATPLPPKGNQFGDLASQSQPQQPPQAQNQATPLPPKGNHFRDQAGQSQPKQPPQDQKQATPLPPKGNHSEGETLPYEDWESLYAATKLPDWETQVELFKGLRDCGVEIPSDDELRGHPAEALRHCETARYFQKCRQPATPPAALGGQTATTFAP